MCDVLDLSVRCQSQQLTPVVNINDWTAKTSGLPVTEMATSPSLSNCNATQYDLEPVSPISTPSPHSPPSFVANRPPDAFYPRPTQPSPTPARQWTADSPVVTASSAQPAASSVPRQWNGDGGHPYSPLKRVLHQYRNSVAAEERSGSESSSLNGGEVVPTPAALSTAASTLAAGRKPITTTTAGMSFEEFVLGMLSKVGGGKAITAATQSYLRETAAFPSNRGDRTVPETRTPDVVQTATRAVDRASEARRQMERQVMTTSNEYTPSPYHPGLMTGVPPYQHSHRPLPSDVRLVAATSLPPPVMMRRPPATTTTLRVDDRDDAYRERRRKNNEAAKRSRDSRRLKELQVAAQAERLAEENLQLKAEIAVLRSQLGYLHRMMLDNNNGSHVINGVGTEDDHHSNGHRSNSGHQYSPPDDGGRAV